MVDLIRALGEHFGVFVVGAGLFCVLVTAVIKGVVTIAVASSRERTRREIAAYIAEGTIAAEQGERLLKTPVDGKDRTI